METSTLTSKGQILIPKRLRAKYGIESGAKVLFEETPAGVLIKPMNEAFFKSFAGILTSGNLKEDMKIIRGEEAASEKRKFKAAKK
ncbi:MAG TPA: AbrB/MazE/SpoVT family DNA-binding domain-containing protein [Niabella sp.]|nr:AbrB/MazE/SpoVT family DNA-binding domain-containing protein [Niabella sp.]